MSLGGNTRGEAGTIRSIELIESIEGDNGATIVSRRFGVARGRHSAAHGEIRVLRRAALGTSKEPEKATIADGLEKAEDAREFGVAVAGLRRGRQRQMTRAFMRAFGERRG